MVGDILQPTHLIFVLVVALLVLGPKRLPEVGRALGRGLRDFRSALSGEEQQRPDEVVQHTSAASPDPVYEPQPAYQPVPPEQPEAVQPVPDAEPVREHADHTA